jgi:hypothetical protein
MSELSALDLMVVKSVQLIVGKGNNIDPVSFGSGCIVKYRESHLLITVAHVTGYEDTATCIVTNQPPENKHSKLYCVGTMNYFDEYTSKNLILADIQGLDDLLKGFVETIDFGYCELKDQFEIIQPELNFGFHKVEKSFKMYIDLDAESDTPSKENFYGFCGNIRHNKTQSILQSSITLKYDLRYHRTKGRIHMFLAPDVITDVDDYKGCSGAPILDNHGKLVALAVAVVSNSKIVLGLSIHEVKRLLDYYFDIKAIENKNDN